jgi:membrane protease YdiL (CAAX protease family)
MWQKLPVWFRAVVLGLIVAGVPTLIWGILAAVNLKFTPVVPWSVVAMAVVLWVYWRYLRSDERLRAVPLSQQKWRLALIAGGLGIAAVWAAFGALRGVLHIVQPADDISRFPIWTIAAAIVMGSAVAGVTEEAGFRGFMQLPLERAYGPVTAIAITSIIFTAIHLTHGARILPFLPFYLVVAVIYSLLTLITRSILPSMLLHFTGDVMMFAFQYLNLRLKTGGAGQTGRIEIVPAIAALVLGAASAVAFRYLAREGRPAPPAQVPVMSH